MFAVSSPSTEPHRPRRPGLKVRHAGVVVEVQLAASRRGVPHPRKLRQWAEFVCAAVTDLGSPRPSLPPGSLTLRIVGTAESRRLNRRWRGKDKATNVLSFPAGELTAGTDAETPFGDIAICAPVIRREAHEQGKLPAAHWAHMVVHGVLHLYGFEHEAERDALLMERLEVAALTSLGYPDPYEGRRLR